MAPDLEAAADGTPRQSRRADLGSLLRFGALTLAASVPFYVAGALGGRIAWFPSNLPWAALGFVVPAAVAWFVCWRDGTADDLARELTIRRSHPGWWVAAATAFTVPTYLDAARHGTWAFPPIVQVLGLLAVYVLAALGEEVGWTGFALPRLMRLTGSPTGSALVLAAFTWAWHLLPFIQTGNSPWWVAAQTLQLTCMRAVVAGLAVGSRNTVWIGVVVHALSNLAWSTSPDAGAAYDPLWVDGLLVPIAIGSLVAGTRAHRLREARRG